MRWYADVLKKYAVFSGRARRREFWTFFIISLIISPLLSFAEGFLGLFQNAEVSVLLCSYWLIILVPSLAVGVRRMHDTDHRGWWLVVPLANVIFALMDGTKGPNQFGPDPKGVRALAI